MSPAARPRPHHGPRRRRSFFLSSSFLLLEALQLFKAVQYNNHVAVSHILERHSKKSRSTTTTAPLSGFFAMEKLEDRTPLRVAAKLGNAKLVRVLLANGAGCFTHAGRDHWSALHSAAVGGQEPLLKLLCTEAADVHENILVNGFRVFHLVAEMINPALNNGGSDFLQWALGHFHTLDINASSERRGFAGWTALHLCCARGKMKSLLHLLRHGADLHARTGEFNLHMDGLGAVLAGGMVAHCGRGGLLLSGHSNC